MQFLGKTVEEAIESGLKELSLTKEEVTIKIVSEPVKGLFGRIKSQAVVEIVKNEESENTKSIDEIEFINKLLNLLNISAEVVKSEQDEKEILTLNSEESSSLIGYRGEVLDAIQTLVGAAVNVGKKEYKKLVVDCENYRSRREDTLIKLAHRLEDKATEIKREVQLEPMCAFERRIIHTALADSEKVTTRSDGKEPERFVVIVPNDKDEFSKPYNAGRNEREGRFEHNHNNNRRPYSNGRRDSRERKGGSGFTENKRVAPSGFGTYLGNSLKNK